MSEVTRIGGLADRQKCLQKPRMPGLTKVEAAVEVHVVEKRATNTCLGPQQVYNKESYDGKRRKKILRSPACPLRLGRLVSQTHPRLRVPEF